MISVLVLTFNEEANIRACLDSVRWSDDITVFDSYSTDRTLDIAKNAGARVIQRRWDNEREQRLASLGMKFKYPWVYNPDADETTPSELTEEMHAVVSDSSRQEVAYRVRFKHMFMGRWIKHSSLYPTWVVRLFRPERVRLERGVNLRYLIDGPVGTLRGHFEHYSFNKGLSAWIEKHNDYSSREAEEAARSLSAMRVPWVKLICRDPVRRREALKELSFRLPLRPWLRFCYAYCWRLGFLDGGPGLAYCRLMAWYEFMIDLKLKEIKRRESLTGVSDFRQHYGGS
jgi:glycosyltransferase involved in cell wall biosynthesis